MVLSWESTNAIIMACCFSGILYAIANTWLVSRVKLQSSAGLKESYNKFHDEGEERSIELLQEVGQYVEDGAITFLTREYIYIAVFILILAIVIFFSFTLCDMYGVALAAIGFLSTPYRQR